MSAAAQPRTPPATLTLNPDGIPDELKQLHQFLCWNWEWRDGRWTKPPINPYRDGYAKSTDPDTWAPFDVAVAAYLSRGLAGIGMAVYKEDPFFFLDIDHCRDAETGEIDPWARPILTKFQNTYRETSPSATGMRVIGRGRLPGSKHTKHITNARPGAKIELFEDGKYTTLTGHRYGETTEIIDCQEALDDLYAEFFPPAKTKQSPSTKGTASHANDDDIIARASSAKNGAKFDALMAGDTSGHGDDHSAADLALMSMVAFWTQDRGQLDRIFRRSGLYREKWEREDYREWTIDRAFDRSETYSAPRNFKVHVGGRDTGSNGAGAPPPPNHEPRSTEQEAPRIFNLTDTGNAERLVNRHGQDVRFNWGRGVWYVWTGTHWGEDVSGRMDQLAKETVRAIPEEAKLLEDEARAKMLRHAASSESAGKRSAMVELARSEDGIPVLPEELDADPWLLNVANGTLDLRTGALRAHDRADLITRCLTTAYLDDATCPTFMAFLNRIFSSNTELIAYVQRMIGYSLTGSTREQAILIAHGNGSNGKSTLLGTIASLLEEYAAEADTDSFLEKQGDRIREDVAALDGARFVAASETADGKRLSEAFIKKATGGEKLRARRLFENGYVFMPRFKIWLSTNHRPQIVGTDHAIWRRIRLLPFTVTIPDEERDRDLPAKLEAELPGILAWAVEGCRQWLRHGEQPPPAVLQATEQYRRDMDALANWLEDRCEIRPGVSTVAKALYANYTAYCDGAGEEPLKQRTFGTRLTERGCGEKRTGRSRFRTGIRLRDPNEPAQATFDDDASPKGDASDASDAFSRTFPNNNTFAKDTETNVTNVTNVTFEESVGSCVQCGNVTTDSSLCWSCR